MTKSTLTLALAQADMVVGDVPGNAAKIIEYSNRARDELHADLVVFPELSICGYPPEDLLFHSGLRRRIVESLESIRNGIRDIAVLLGYPEYEGDKIYNACLVCLNGRVLARYRKHMLPNYRVFDEERYFTAGKDAAVFLLNGIRVGLQICEDIWRPAPIAMSRAAGAEVIIAINGSPYGLNAQETRERVARARVSEVRVPIV